MAEILCRVALFVLAAIQVAVAVEAPNGLTVSGDAAAARFVQRFTERTVAVLRDETLAAEQRDATFRSFLLEAIDTEFAGRFALGRGWRMASPTQRKAYLRLFREDLLRTGTRLFIGYDGQTLNVVRVVHRDDGDLIVHARPSDPEVSIKDIDFRLRKHGDGYRIIDIWLEGFSMLHAYRTEFIGHIFRGGVEEVLAKLRARTTRAETYSR